MNPTSVHYRLLLWWKTQPKNDVSLGERILRTMASPVVLVYGYVIGIFFAHRPAIFRSDPDFWDHTFKDNLSDWHFVKYKHWPRIWKNTRFYPAWIPFVYVLVYVTEWAVRSHWQLLLMLVVLAVGLLAFFTITVQAGEEAYKEETLLGNSGWCHHPPYVSVE